MPTTNVKADFSRLQATLLQSGLNQSNPPLYQILKNLIDNNTQSQGFLISQISSVTAGSGTGTGTSVNISKVRARVVLGV